MAWGNSRVSRSGRMPISVGTSFKSTSWTPSDSKSGLRCVARSALLRPGRGAGPQGHVGQLALQALEGLRLALGANVALRLLLAVAAQGREGKGAQAGRRISASQSWQRP